MLRAIALAKKGLGQVSPNPLVGCVIVHQNRIIGEGFHQQYGQAHAEVNAIASVLDTDLLKESTLFVTLEPCAHHGKTPPCADLIIEQKIKKVVIGSGDPFLEVNGEGIKRLRAAEVQVVENFLEPECSSMNRRFLTSVKKGRPYIILKWAQTSDGFIARENYDSKWISNQYSRQLVHKWRGEEDAILVGKNTVNHDDPALTTREWVGKNPIRIVLDHDLKISNKKYQIHNDEAPTFIFNTRKHENNFVKFDGSLASLMLQLSELKIQSIIIEGGARTLSDFIEAGMWDEARIFTAEKTFGKGIIAPTLKGEVFEERDILGDRLQIIKNAEQG